MNLKDDGRLTVLGLGFVGLAALAQHGSRVRTRLPAPIVEVSPYEFVQIPSGFWGSGWWVIYRPVSKELISFFIGNSVHPDALRVATWTTERDAREALSDFSSVARGRASDKGLLHYAPRWATDDLTKEIQRIAGIRRGSSVRTGLVERGPVFPSFALEDWALIPPSNRRKDNRKFGWWSWPAGWGNTGSPLRLDEGWLWIRWHIFHDPPNGFRLELSVSRSKGKQWKYTTWGPDPVSGAMGPGDGSRFSTPEAAARAAEEHSRSLLERGRIALDPRWLAMQGSSVRTGLPASTLRTFVASVGGHSEGPERTATVALITVDPKFFSFAKRAKEAFLKAKKAIDSKQVKADRLIVIPPSTWKVRWFRGSPSEYHGVDLADKLLANDYEGFEIFDFNPLSIHANEVRWTDDSEVYGNQLSVDAMGIDFRAFEVTGLGGRAAVMAYLRWDDPFMP